MSQPCPRRQVFPLPIQTQPIASRALAHSRPPTLAWGTVEAVHSLPAVLGLHLRPLAKICEPDVTFLSSACQGMEQRQKLRSALEQLALGRGLQDFPSRHKAGATGFPKQGPLGTRSPEAQGQPGGHRSCCPRLMGAKGLVSQTQPR